jgi:dihydroorotate dehydrogenase
MGLTFPNRVGLAAGLDKNADYVDALAALGFGFIEVGTITPRPQQGNPQPRLFRLTEQKAVINRMGFNNKGIEHAVRQLEKTRYRGILGINIGKNKDTPLDKAIDDYLTGFRALWKYASYITINISSPNTPGLRDLQHGDMLDSLLAALKQEQARIAAQEKKYVPLVVKISPDLSAQELQELASVLLQRQVDGVIATNTTLRRDGTEQSPFTKEAGGLSGKPLEKLSTQIISQLCAALQDKIPVIASGGVMDRQSAADKLNAGAKLLQVYTGFIYGGVNIISELGKL